MTRAVDSCKLFAGMVTIDQVRLLTETIRAASERANAASLEVVDALKHLRAALRDAEVKICRSADAIESLQIAILAASSATSRLETTSQQESNFRVAI